MKIILWALLSLSTAWAGPLTVTFTAPAQSVLPGLGIDYYGVIVNLSPDTVFLNSNSFTLNLDAAAFVLTDYFFNTPLSLDPGTDSGEILLFRLDVNTPFPQPYGLTWVGTYGLLGGIDGNAADNLTEQSFRMQVLDPSLAEVPEPSMLLATGSALGLLLWLHHRPQWARKLIRYTEAFRNGTDRRGSGISSGFDAPVPRRRPQSSGGPGGTLLSAAP